MIATRQAYTAPVLTPRPLVNSILHGDALAQLRTLPDHSVDAVVTDPPYGLGKVKDIAGLLMAWMNDEDDRRYTSKSGFMGKAWDYGVPGPRYWKEVYRVMKPGAHLLAFGGTRTYDLLVIALRLSGFECRNLLAWIHGQGFPKSLNIGKATGLPEHEGIGTDLKPALEPICLARKPLAEPTIAANVLRYGTGGLNIDASRIGTHDYSQEQWNKKELARTTGNTYGVHKPSVTEVPQGRFPSNTLFSHTLLCRQVGTKRVPTDGGPRKSGGVHRSNLFPMGETVEDKTRASLIDGLEEVDAWECVPECPVHQLSLQSGQRASNGRYGESGSGKQTGLFGIGSKRQQTYFDEGTAARYFAQFAPDLDDIVPFVYQSKPSRKERNAGCEGLPERKKTGVYDERPSGNFHERLDRNKQEYKLREDLTPEQRAHVEAELAKIGGAI